jgi:hypothetical protein
MLDPVQQCYICPYSRRQVYDCFLCRVRLPGVDDNKLLVVSNQNKKYKLWIFHTLGAFGPASRSSILVHSTV